VPKSVNLEVSRIRYVGLAASQPVSSLASSSFLPSFLPSRSCVDCCFCLPPSYRPAVCLSSSLSLEKFDIASLGNLLENGQYVPKQKQQKEKGDATCGGRDRLRRSHITCERSERNRELTVLSTGIIRSERSAREETWRDVPKSEYVRNEQCSCLLTFERHF
jgi:hypothetical protein